MLRNEERKVNTLKRREPLYLVVAILLVAGIAVFLKPKSETRVEASVSFSDRVPATLDVSALKVRLDNLSIEGDYSAWPGRRVELKDGRCSTKSYRCGNCPPITRSGSYQFDGSVLTLTDKESEESRSYKSTPLGFSALGPRTKGSRYYMYVYLSKSGKDLREMRKAGLRWVTP